MKMTREEAQNKVAQIIPKTVTIRVDIDTLIGLKKGIPPLLDLFEQDNTPSTFFAVMGPDTMGQHMKRFKNGSYWKRIIKVNPVKLIRKYGLKPFFYGTLIKAPRIGGDHPALIKTIEEHGHEIICHGYNHAGWADKYEEYTLEIMKEQLELSWNTFETALGKKPHASGVPNWRTDYRALDLSESYGFEYLADVRGHTPFYPVNGTKTYQTLQLPITLPTTHELLQTDVPRNEVIDRITSEMHEGYNVFCIHDWFEGLYNLDFVEDFIVKCKEKGYRFITMREAAAKIKKSGLDLPRNKIGNKSIKGGVKLITHQLWD